VISMDQFASCATVETELLHIQCEYPMANRLRQYVTNREQDQTACVRKKSFAADDDQRSRKGRYNSDSPTSCQPKAV